MATTIQHRRGTTTEHASFTGAVGEVTYNTTTKSVHTHDGVTAGGFPLTKAADLSASTGASLVGYLPSGAGAVASTVQGKLRERVSVKDFGAVGDGVADDTAALALAAASLQDGQSLDFGSGTFLISYQGDPYSSVFGNVVMDFLNKKKISLVGIGATIKVSSHNIGTYGGLRFANFKGCKHVHIEGLHFDMTFTGVNTAASFYPFCGAITAIDDDSAAPNFSALNSDFTVQRCSFKLFHPYGNWALSGAPYAGDQNNGYKLFSIFASGPNTPSADNQLCRNFAVEQCTWLDGHNGYGIWFWAWMACRVVGNTVDSWVTKHSNASGVYQGGGVAFIRNIPWWAHGMVVQGNQFRSKPSSERVADFAGIAQFYVQANNMGAAGSGKGETVIGGNNIIIGGSTDLGDHGVFFNDFGNLIVDGNHFDGHDGQSNTVGALGVKFVPTEGGGAGECSLSVTGNTFGAWMHGSAIYFVNGSDASAAARQCRSLVVADNIQRSGDFFLRMTGYSYKTYEGCPYTVITGNVIDGTRTSQFPPPSGNNYGIAYASNVAGDVGIIANNVFINKTEPIKTEVTYCSFNASLSRYGNSYYGISTPYNASNVFPVDKLEIANVKFPAAQVASSDSNTLDDYEEGVFTPVVIGATSSGTGTYSTQIGRFQKVGNRVNFTLNVAWTAHTGSGNILINGLPHSCVGVSYPCAVVSTGVVLTAGYSLNAFVAINTAQIQPLQVASSGAVNLVPLGATGTLYLSGSYETSN